MTPPDLPTPQDRRWWLMRYVAGKGVLELSEEDRELILEMFAEWKADREALLRVAKMMGLRP